MSNNVRIIRKHLGITQVELARRAGMSFQQTPTPSGSVRMPTHNQISYQLWSIQQ
jgi:transcriptional regulator with XRE-family HTH domain